MKSEHTVLAAEALLQDSPATTPGVPHAVLQGVTRKFGKAGSVFHALGPIDLTLYQGEFFSVVAVAFFQTTWAFATDMTWWSEPAPFSHAVGEGSRFVGRSLDSRTRSPYNRPPLRPAFRFVGPGFLSLSETRGSTRGQYEVCRQARSSVRQA